MTQWATSWDSPMNDPTFEEMVELVREHYIDDDPTTPAESLRNFYPSTVGELRTNLLTGLIERSEDSKLEWDAVALIAQQALRSGEQLPQALADWVADVLVGDRPRPTKGAQAKAARDFRWRLAICHLQNAFGLAPTRNETSNADSGCDVVAEAAGAKYKTVEAVWSGRGDFFRPS